MLHCSEQFQGSDVRVFLAFYNVCSERLVVDCNVTFDIRNIAWKFSSDLKKSLAFPNASASFSSLSFSDNDE